MMYPRNEPIAIIGSACRFPGGVNSPRELWDLLQSPKDVSGPIPSLRFGPQECNTKAAYFLGGQGDESQHRRFDARFFNISRGEANAIDPQVRMLLEVVYEAVEGAAGCPMDTLRGSDTAVYTGVMTGDYERIMTRDGRYENVSTYHATGASRAMASNRVSHCFDWRGPSLTVDTACSSSLVAVHLAVQQLRSPGGSRLAVATGACLMLDALPFVSQEHMRMLSPTGRSRMWDAAADGYARGEGLAAVALKTLRAAEEDGDVIECVIRETGINQDGWAGGITVPSARAQETLIRDCYIRSGLDPRDPTGRPQFFEAHGTGTPTGDPIEAEAIYSAFFSGGDNQQDDAFTAIGQPLLVGSIKTVIGHTEGAAGVAGLIKASLALQFGVVPPNLHFNKVNERIAPFLSRLRVPTSSASTWPTGGRIRRASVNSFGFGGTNAHAIVESYPCSDEHSLVPRDVISPNYYTLVITAASEAALLGYLASLRDYVRANIATVSVRDIAYTMHIKRTRFAVGVVLAPASPQDLFDQLEDRLQHLQATQVVGKRMTPGQVMSQNLTAKSMSGGKKIIGVFTGQGAQWARQGHDLIASSSSARRIIETLDDRLSQLPKQDRPTWTLLGELEKGPESSNVHQAYLSQPLTTAIQILQVQLLQEAGVTFSAVVGHSSGEIAAAYAAGVISADDAICIAYYRGLFSHLSSGSRGLPGSMVSVSCSAEDIQPLIKDAEAEGLVVIAAYNSPRNLTLSGDADAVSTVINALEDAAIPAKRLKIDKAYHSHHMAPCSMPYLEALLALDVCVRENRCPWVSTVTGEPIAGLKHADHLRAEYWNDNMIRPVLFTQALRKAFQTTDPFGLGIELGPHPALRNAVADTFLSTSQQDVRLPYTGVCYRNKDSARSFAEALGYIWTSQGTDSVDFQAYDKFMRDDNASSYKLVKDLPRYAWDHDIDYWHESRQSEAMRTHSVTPHALLGRREAENDGRDEMRWRHLLRPKNVAWLNGHCIQNQIVFPASGYVVMAIEAALILLQSQRHELKTVEAVEVLDVEIPKALTFDSDDDMAELIVSLSRTTTSAATRTANMSTIDASFTCKRATAVRKDEAAAFDVLATCQVRLHQGRRTAAGALPARRSSSHALSLAKVEADEFYASLSSLGYGYSSPFRGLAHLQRRLGCATGSILSPSQTDHSGYLVSPWALDAAFQSVLLAKSSPGDGELRSIHVPCAIGRILVDVPLCEANRDSPAMPLSFDTVNSPYSTAIEGDVEIYRDKSPCVMIQVDNISLKPISTPTRENDKEMFSHVVWVPMSPDARCVANHVVSEKQRRIASLLERLSVYHLRALDRDFPSNHPSRQAINSKHLLHFASHVVSQAEGGQLPLWKSRWAHDTYDQILDACRPFEQLPDFRLLKAVGESLGDIVRGIKSAIEVGIEDDLLTEYYATSMDTSTYNRYLTGVVGQIAHRHPRLNILEVGAGTGAATKRILEDVGDGILSYMFTDVSSGFFGPFQEEHREDYSKDKKMSFRTLDISRDPKSQGFDGGSYDIVVASFVLHATPCLVETLRHVRYLLRPGGYLVVAELLPEPVARLGAIFGAFPGWWLGAEEGRVLSPCVSITEWDRLLRVAGFSGCDTVSPKLDSLVQPTALFVSQAVDDNISILRDPMGSATVAQANIREDFKIQELVLIGGDSSRTKELKGQLWSILGHYCRSITTLKSVSKFRSDPNVLPTTTMTTTTKKMFISIEDLDRPLMEDPSANTWKALRDILSVARGLVWVTQSRQEAAPYSNMMVGLLRCASREYPSLDTLSLDFEHDRPVDARVIAETLLRFHLQLHWQQDPTDDRTERLILTEPEIVMRKDGCAEVPRLIPNSAMNRRYNSACRRISEDVRPHDEDVHVATIDAGFYLRKTSHQLECSPGSDQAKVLCSLSLPARVTASTSMYLMISQVDDANDYYVSLSSTCGSIIQLRGSISVMARIGPLSPVSASTLLRFLTYQITARTILRGVGKGDKILIHEANQLLAEALDQEANIMAVQVTYTTCASEPSFDQCRAIHPRASRREIARIIPKDVTLFVDVSGLSGAASPLSETLKMLLPPCTRREDANTIFPPTVFQPHMDDSTSSSVVEVQDYLSRAVKVAERRALIATTSRATPCDDETDFLRVVPTRELDRQTVETRLPKQLIIDWVPDSIIPVQSVQADALVQFSASKVYWLVGLTKDLGISLCEWMAHNGAKHIVLSSRHPRVSKAWLEKMDEDDVKVRIKPCDITNELELIRVYEEIQEMALPIGGVAQGAMVLKDVLIQGMTLDDLRAVRRPKVEGSINLTNLFKNATLEFFVFFSSISCMTGLPGQANYSAANMFMASLAQRRRRRGLAASVINIGAIVGVGYISREMAESQSTLLLQNLLSDGYATLSERDFHQLFAEAVIAGRPGSQGPFEISTGLTTTATRLNAQNGVEQVALPNWAATPLLSNIFRLHQEGYSGPMATQPTQVLPLNTRLSLAPNMDEARALISSALGLELEKFFHMDRNSLSGRDLSQVRLDEAGIDSLIASEIRVWFIKSLGFSIPLLKILTGGTVSELVMTAASMLPDSAIPRARTSPASDLRPDGNHYRPDEEHDEATTISGWTTSTPWSAADNSSLDLCDTTSSREPPSLPAYEKDALLSPAQELFWFSRQLLNDKTSLNHVVSFRVRGAVHSATLDQAVKEVTQRHEPLRSCFVEQDGQVRQRVLKSGILRLEERQISGDTGVAAAVAELERHVFDVEMGETMRIFLLSVSLETQYLVLGSHSLVMDGQSLPVFMRELGRSYTGDATTTANQGLQKQPLSHDLSNFQSSLAYWKQELAEIPETLPVLPLSKANFRSPLATCGNIRATLRIKRPETEKIRALCSQSRVTPFHFYLSVFRGLLSRYYTDTEYKLSIGIADANRSLDDETDKIGVFVNTLPLIFCSPGSAVFADILAEARDKSYEALGHAAVPFQVLIDELKLPRSQYCTPIFQCFMDYRMGHSENISLGHTCQLELQSFNVTHSMYDVALDVIDDSTGDCTINVILRSDLYCQQDAERLAKEFGVLAAAFVENPWLTLDAPDTLAEAEAEQILAFSRGLSRGPIWPDTIIHRFDEIAKEAPYKAAVSDEARHFTYEELDCRAQSIASAMKIRQLARGSRVAVLQEPGIEWVASILAIMRIGAIYVPLDIDNPPGRLIQILHDCQPDLLLVDNSTHGAPHKLSLCEGLPARLDMTEIPTLSGQGKSQQSPVSVEASQSDAAVILYTSGSTGTPKGIVQKHRGLRNWLESMPERFGLGHGTEVWLQQSSAGFDMSLVQIFAALCNAGRVHVTSSRHRRDPEAVVRVLAEQGVTCTFASVSEYTAWFAHGGIARNSPSPSSLSLWRAAFVGGEAGVETLAPSFAALRGTQTRSRPLRLFNAYGPTETTFGATSREVCYDSGDRGSVDGSVGSPFPNYAVYVMDPGARRFMPVGVRGEIFIAGLGVAAGYLNNEAQTAEKFVPSHLVTPNDIARGWTEMHRTGDLGRWRADGSLVLEGRVAGDTQVKLRGVRIDLQEIETAIKNKDTGIAEAVVSVRQPSPPSKGQAFLVAYVTFKDTHPTSEHQELLDSLNEAHLELPQYMCPAAFGILDKMPYTNSFKLDRKAIATLPMPAPPGSLAPQLSQVEVRLKTIWEEAIPAEVVNMHTINSKTDFFHVGGTSLLLLRLQALVRESFGTQLPISHMYSSSTLGAMAKKLERRTGSDTAMCSPSHLNWDEETAPTAADMIPYGVPTTVPASLGDGPRVVVLTGSTGHLGQALLKALVKDTAVHRIHCLAVRNPSHSSFSAFGKSLYNDDDTPKVVVHRGDLLQSRLGLSEDDASAIFAAATLVIHNGADVSFQKSYPSLRPANLGSTRELAHLCLPRRIPFHFVSSASVCAFFAAASDTNNSSMMAVGPISMASWPPPTNIHDHKGGQGGYAVSKWAAEVFLERLQANQPAWPVRIHRPSHIERIGHPAADVGEALRHYSRSLGAVPILGSRVRGEMNWVPLEVVVRSIIDTAWPPRRSGSGAAKEEEEYQGGLQFLHHIGSESLSFANMRDWALTGAPRFGEKNLGQTRGQEHGGGDESVDEIPINDWVDRAGGLGMHPTMVELIRSFGDQEGLFLPKLARGPEAT